MYDAIRAFFSPILSFPLSLIYEWTGSYVLAIFLLTFIIKWALLPVSIKQQKNSAKQTRLNAKVNRIRQKYANNQQKAQQEIQALYQREGFGAANMGCMPLMIQMIVMIGLYGVIYTPLSSVLRFGDDTIEKIANVLKVTPSELGKYNDFGKLYLKANQTISVPKTLRTYKIAPGDTLTIIMEKTGLSAMEILELNANNWLKTDSIIK